MSSKKNSTIRIHTTAKLSRIILLTYFFILIVLVASDFLIHNSFIFSFNSFTFDFNDFININYRLLATFSIFNIIFFPFYLKKGSDRISAIIISGILIISICLALFYIYAATTNNFIG